MNATIFVLCMLPTVNPAPVPTQLQGGFVRLSELPEGGRVRVYSQALVMDTQGRAWLRKDYVASVSRTKWDRNKELEVINNKLGWIVRVHPTYRTIDGYKIPAYPKWEKEVVSHYTHYPVKAINVVQPPRARVNRPMYVRVGVSTGPVFRPPYYRHYVPRLQTRSPGVQYRQ